MLQYPGVRALFSIVYCVICKFRIIQYYSLRYMQIPYYSVLFTALEYENSIFFSIIRYTVPGAIDHLGNSTFMSMVFCTPPRRNVEFPKWSICSTMVCVYLTLCPRPSSIVWEHPATLRTSNEVLLFTFRTPDYYVHSTRWSIHAPWHKIGHSQY